MLLKLSKHVKNSNTFFNLFYISFPSAVWVNVLGDKSHRKGREFISYWGPDQHIGWFCIVCGTYLSTTTKKIGVLCYKASPSFTFKAGFMQRLSDLCQPPGKHPGTQINTLFWPVEWFGCVWDGCIHVDNNCCRSSSLPSYKQQSVL